MKSATKLRTPLSWPRGLPDLTWALGVAGVFGSARNCCAGRRDEARRTACKNGKRPLRAHSSGARCPAREEECAVAVTQSWSRADGKRLVSTRAQERYALIPIVSTPLYAPDAPPVTIGVCVAICLGVLSAKTSSRSTLTEVKFAALAK